MFGSISRNYCYTVNTTGFAGTQNPNNPDHHLKNELEREFVLRRVNELFGEPPEGSFLKWQCNDHDFGYYYDLAILYPKFWDEVKELKVSRWIDKVESHDWETEELELQNLWDMRSLEKLNKDTEAFDLIDLEP